MNTESSRSHMVFCLNITINNLDEKSCKVSKLYLVDLAGSEKCSKSGLQGQRLEEAKGINLSLTSLGKVIVALTDKKLFHIPYRESSLTKILSESLGGNSKTCMIVTVSPHSINQQETLSSLRFGSRAKNIKNVPIINKEPTIAELKNYLDKAEKTIRMLLAKIDILVDHIRRLGG